MISIDQATKTEALLTSYLVSWKCNILPTVFSYSTNVQGGQHLIELIADAWYNILKKFLAKESVLRIGWSFS